MLYGLLITLFIFISILLAIIILIQQSKENMGLGNLGGSAQMIFGGSGGQEFLQKVTWTLAALFMGLSLLLSLMRAQMGADAYTPATRKATPAQSAPMAPSTAAPATPVVPTAPASPVVPSAPAPEL